MRLIKMRGQVKTGKYNTGQRWRSKITYGHTKSISCGEKSIESTCVQADCTLLCLWCTCLSPLRMRHGCVTGGGPSIPKYRHTDLKDEIRRNTDTITNMVAIYCI